MSPSAITEVVRALGSWDLTLTDRTPQHIVDQLLNGRFGHIAVDAARDNPQVLGDALLSTARYVGVLRGASHEAGQLALKGAGMAVWLGAADGVGDVFETAVVFADVPFATAITGLLPPGGAVTAGTITTPAGAVPYKGSHRYQTPRQAIDYVVDLYSCDWRVNGDATLDVGPPDALFVDDPRAAVIRRADGFDMGLRALPGSSRLDSDVEDFSTRVVTLAEGEGASIAVGTADIQVNPYVDLHGNSIKLTRLVSESNTSLTNADARAALALAQFTTPRDQVSLSTDTHDIRGDLQAGDSVWVYDPDAGLVDENNEIVFRGDRISPVKLRVFQVSWPVEAGMGVYFRTPAGEWLDLSDYVAWEDGATNLTVGGYDRPLTNTNESIGFRPNITNPDADNSTPGVPAFTPPFDQGLEVGPGGLSRASLLLTWSGPALNTDGSPFVDGAHFDIRYRPAPDYQPTWGDLSSVTWGDLEGAPWGALASGAGIENPEWTYTAAPADASVALLQGLVPGVAYEIQIRAVDAANPPHAGDWSESLFEFIGEDTIAPQPPAAPTVAASLVQVSVRHTLGLAAGGTFNLPLDLAYLEVHVGASETFTPDDSTRVGKIIATRAQILGQIPVVGTFPVATPSQVWVRVIAVDQSGNASDPSAAAPVTVELIDSQWVSDLTADKITAGSLTASYSLVGLLRAGTPGGARFEAGDDGTRIGMMLHRPTGTVALHGDATTGDLVAYRPDGITRTFRLEASTGNVYLYKDGTTPALTLTASTGLIDLIGKVTSGSGVGLGSTVVIDPAAASVDLYPNATAKRFRLRALNADLTGGGTGPILDLIALNASGVHRGPFIHMEAVADTTGLTWIGHTGADGAAQGGILKLDQFGQAILGTEDANVWVDGDDVFLLAGSGANIVPNVPVGDPGVGFSFLAQNGAAEGYRWVISGGELRCYRNADNGPVGDGAGGLKSFVIPHPIDDDRWLVHGCIEAPEAAVEYRGVAEIVDGRAEVELPPYFEAATRPEGRTVHLTMLLPDTPLAVEVERPRLPGGPVGFDGLGPKDPGPPHVIHERALLHPVAASVPRDGWFRISSPAPDGTRVAWLVKAVRADVTPFEVEPLRSGVQVSGDGPYRYLTPAA